MDVVANIRAFNAGREPERLQMKYRKMHGQPFVFLRGTCHLFYDRLPSHPLLKTAPPVWVCGDLHLENFGSYKGNNRLIYFDINDFDEAALAPATWDLVRMLTSIRLGAEQQKMKQAEGARLCAAFLASYARELDKGKALWVERDTADGLVKDLIEHVQERKRTEFLADRTVLHPSGRRALRIDKDGEKKKMLAASQPDREAVVAAMRTFAGTQDDAGFYKVVDVARRVAGTGALGLGRFTVLVEGKGSPDGNYLLDLKQSTPSSLIPHLTIAQPRWDSEAERVVELQQRMQAVSAAFLHPVSVAGQSFVLRELQPTDDAVDIDKKSFDAVEQLVKTMGSLVAWSQLRSAGRGGSANADSLIAFGKAAAWQETLVGLSDDCAAQVRRDSAEFDQGFDRGAFATP